jgi:hypothetical protein
LEKGLKIYEFLNHPTHIKTSAEGSTEYLDKFIASSKPDLANKKAENSPVKQPLPAGKNHKKMAKIFNLNHQARKNPEGDED